MTEDDGLRYQKLQWEPGPVAVRDPAALAGDRIGRLLGDQQAAEMGIGEQRRRLEDQAERSAKAAAEAKDRRERIATAVLTGMGLTEVVMINNFTGNARYAVLQADALIAELDK